MIRFVNGSTSQKKTNMNDTSGYHKSKKFLKLPRMRESKEQFKKFIRENQKYPAAAIENKIEGDVIIKYKITDNGDVFDPSVIKGLGYGCDEEAVRLVKMIRYNAVKNRGVRVTAHSKIKIPFRLPKEKKQQKIKMVYTQTPAAKEPEKKKKEQEKSPYQKTYNYTIKF